MNADIHNKQLIMQQKTKALERVCVSCASLSVRGRCVRFCKGCCPFTPKD